MDLFADRSPQAQERREGRIAIRGRLQDWDEAQGRGTVVTDDGVAWQWDTAKAPVPSGGRWLCRTPRPGLFVDFDPAPDKFGTIPEPTVRLVHRLLPPPRPLALRQPVLEVLAAAEREADLSTAPTRVPGAKLGALWGKQWTNQASDGLREGLRECRARTLVLAGSNISEYGAHSLAAGLCDAAAHGQLRVAALDLTECYILEGGCGALAAALPSTKISRLNLWKNQIADTGCEILAKALHDTQVTWLGLRSNYIKQPGCAALAAALPGSRVSSLDLCNNFLGDDGAAALAACLYDTFIETLMLEGCSIGAEGARELATPRDGAPREVAQFAQDDELRVMPLAKVKQLNLSCNPVTCRGAGFIGEHARQMGALQQLELRHCAIEDLGFRRLLTGVQRCDTLRRLDLEGNRVRLGRDAAAAFAQCITQLPVTHLSLAYNCIPDSCGKMKVVKVINRKELYPDPDADPVLEPVGMTVAEDGITVTSVTHNGPADRGGIQPGVIIQSINHRRVASKLLTHPSQVQAPFDLDSGAVDERLGAAKSFPVEVLVKSNKSGMLAVEDTLSRRKMPLGMAPDPAVPLWSEQQWKVRGRRAEGRGQPDWEELPLPSKLESFNIEGNPCTLEEEGFEIQQRLDALLAAP
eukprot:TRINITY_DN37209_c0_g1_i1.p1 TRINITY_DN37209_c0_g1~~TRINITY_DN37209_c0_g1_i1.p1  ORF type:complete len:639 (+),score=193.37 TRINITY_DN37209_c0_g1_i1:78-1994(+)